MPKKLSTLRTDFVLEQKWVLNGTVVENVVEVDDKLYVKLGHSEKWLCEFSTNVAAYKCPLGKCEVFETMQGLLKQAQSGGSPDKVANESPFADLGLDPMQEERGTKGWQKKQQEKKRKKDRLATDAVSINMKQTPKSEEMVEISVLNKSCKESIWMEFSERALLWFREYVSEEITQQQKNELLAEAGEAGIEKQEKRGKDRKKAYWITSNSSWRVKWRDANGSWAEKDFPVSRKLDKETFRATAAQQEALAITWFSEHHYPS